MRGVMRTTGVAMTLLLVAGPLAAQGGGRGPAMGRAMIMDGPDAMGRNPVALMLEHAEALELTDEQVATLEGLRARLEEENGPRRAQLREVFGGADPRTMTADERQAVRDRMRELEPVRDAIRETNRAVMDEAHELLTDGQQATLHRVMMRRGHRGPAGPGLRGQRPGHRMMGAAWRAGYRQGMVRGWRAAHRHHRRGW